MYVIDEMRMQRPAWGYLGVGCEQETIQHLLNTHTRNPFEYSQPLRSKCHLVLGIPTSAATSLATSGIASLGLLRAPLMCIRSRAHVPVSCAGAELRYYYYYYYSYYYHYYYYHYY